MRPRVPLHLQRHNTSRELLPKISEQEFTLGVGVDGAAVSPPHAVGREETASDCNFQGEGSGNGGPYNVSSCVNRTIYLCG